MEQCWQTPGFLIEALQDSRRRTLQLVSDLNEEQLRVPLLPIINPIVWEVGHVGWFQEKWVLRHARGGSPLLENADALWDSAAVAHDTRWDLPLLSMPDTLAYLERVLERVIEGLERDHIDQDQAYFCWLATMHEDMHGEALTYTRQTLGFPAPPSGLGPKSEAGPKRDVEFSGGTFLLGARRGRRFVFDNEKWEHPVELKAFAMARAPVSNGEFAAFVDDGGYRRPELWSEDGLRWREQSKADAPLYWIRDRQSWHVRRFDQNIPLDPNTALIHVNWYEADAYCRWARRRLPTEAEWEFAAGGPEKREYPNGNDPASTDTPEGLRHMMGHAWQWTSDDFGPYPGFIRDPYKEYSEPWFGPPYKVLRGGAWTTQPRLVRNTWRNFYAKDRRDVFAGFRTCALSA